MDVLGVASEINSELGKIRHRYNNHIMTAQERSDIFETVETCLINDLVTIIELSICDYQSQKELIKWSYNLTDKDYIQREGDDLETIIDTIDNHPKAVFIASSFQLSPKYRELDFIEREELLKDTILSEKYKQPKNPDRKKSNQNNKQYSLNSIKNELTELLSKINPDKNFKNWVIYSQIENLFNLQYIECVKFGVLNSSRIPMEKWSFNLTKNKKINRDGKPINEILVAVKKNHGDLFISIELQFTDQFENLLESQQQQKLQGTDFEKGKISIFQII